MAPAGMRYTLVGFSELLDWRPLRFVEPIPPSSICAACGLVRPATARFRCQHILCEFCYKESAQGDARVCPLDGHQCLDEDVDWDEIAADALLKSQVRCWNEHGGCKAVMAACELSEHFLNECRYHSTSCPKCSAPVLCVGVHAHLIADCSDSVPSGSHSDQRGSDNRSEPVALADCTRLLDERTTDINMVLDEILNRHTAHNNALSEVERRIEALKKGIKGDVSETSRHRGDNFGRSAAVFAGEDERDGSESIGLQSGGLTGASERIKKLRKTLRQELKLVAGQIRCDVARNAAKIDTMHSELMDASGEALSRLETVTAQTSLERAIYRFAVERIGDLAGATRNGPAQYLGNYVYLRGYYMSPGLRLREHGDTVSLHAWILVRKGEHDESLEWPMRMAVKFSAIHPGTWAERADSYIRPISDIVSRTEETLDEPRLQKLSPSFLMSDLQRDGFVKDDRLLLKYELIARRSLR